MPSTASHGETTTKAWLAMSEDSSGVMMETAEEAEMDAVDVKDDDEKALSDPGASTNQTRFSFYDADEINDALTPSSAGEDDDPNRFNFYNAKEVNRQSRDIVAKRNEMLDTLLSKKYSPLRSRPGRREARNSDLREKSGAERLVPGREQIKEIDTADEDPPQSMIADSDEILRSLQETERERNQRRGHRGADATPRHANTNGSYSQGYVHRDDRSSLREEDVAEAALRKRVESFENLRPSSNGRSSGKKNNPYEEAIREAILMLRQQYSKPLAQVQSSEAAASDAEGDDPILLRRTPDRILRSRLEEEDEGDSAEISDQVSDSPGDAVSSFESTQDGKEQSASDVKDDEVASEDSEQELDNLAREERIAKYASRLAVLEPPDAMVGDATPEESDLLSPPQDLEMRKAQSDDLFRETEGSENAPNIMHGDPVAQSLESNRKDSFTDQSGTTFESREEEVQRGVERVLLAILERAGSCDTGDRRQPLEVDRLLQTRSSFDSEVDGIVKDSLSQALEALVNPHGSDSVASTHNDREARPTRRRVEREPSDLGETESGMKNLSVVDELLAEEETLREIAKNKKQLLKAATGVKADLGDGDYDTPSSTLLEHGISPKSTISKSFDMNESEHEYEDSVTLESMDGGNDSISRVLGPLSKKAGGTTGVVLEPSVSPSTQAYEDDEDYTDTDDESTSDSDTDSTASPTILQSLSVNAESFMSFMSSALTNDSPKEKDAFRDKYAADVEEEESIDEEARELMRTLCAHLLPYGVDPSSKQEALEKIPAWDDSNPNEAGYRIIRLSRSQLRRVEREFQKMLNSVIDKSERSLSGANDSAPAKLDTETKESDRGFERDLEEAEELLDREEKRYNAVKAGELLEKRTPDADNSHTSDSVSSAASDESLSGSETLSSGDESDNSSDEEPAVEAHPDFPGVRPSGKGEMGDLEYFHLPIIYKSNVTGFEPTKDLFLEPGNIVAGQYLVENEIGSAAFSTAYRCIDLNSETTTESGTTHEEVCLKVIKNTKDFFDQSLDEIKILELLRKTGKCDENCIVEMKTFFYHREHLIIVTELLRQNLFEFGKFIIDNDEEPYFTLSRLCYITRQVLIALDFVHKLRLVHSDVKPENILLSSYSRAKVKLIDFGSSCYLTDRQSSYIQSRSYRAPEVVLGLPYDGKIDIWSLGCVVAEMYTGEVTFQNDSIVSMLSRIEAICGPFPRHMIASGRQSGRFFANSGLLYEQVESSGDEEKKDPSGLLSFEGDEESDDDSRRHRDSQPLFDVFQPKSTTLAARLGFDSNLMERPKGTAEEEEQVMFVDFVRTLLTIDPDGRPTAEAALRHPWIVMGRSLTEEDIKYPSS